MPERNALAANSGRTLPNHTDHRPRAATTGLGWHVFTGLSAVGVIVLCALSPQPRWFLILPGLALLIAAYIWTVLHDRLSRPVGAMLIAAAVAGYALVSFGSPAGLLLLFVLIAQFFWFLTPGIAGLATVAAALVSVAVIFHHDLANAELLAVFLMVAALFGVLVGLWLSQVFTLNARQEVMIEELRASRAEVARQSALRGASEERSRVAQEIHDGLAQQISATLMLLRSSEDQLAKGDTDKAAERLSLARRHTELSVAESRFLLGHSRMDEQDRALDDLVTELVTLFRQTAEIETALSISDAHSNEDISAETTRTVLGVLSEALSNCLRHSQATQIVVELGHLGNQLKVTVADNGVGMDQPTGTASGAHGWGLAGAPDRVKGLGGTFDLDTAPGRGTTITVSLPTNQENAS